MVTTISVKKEQADEFHRQKRGYEMLVNKSVPDWEFMQLVLDKMKTKEGD